MHAGNFVLKSMRSASVLLLALLAASSTYAHVTIMSPAARTPDNSLTEHPCGGVPAGFSAATYAAGTEIEIMVDLDVQHVDSMQAYISFDGFETRAELTSISTPSAGTYQITTQLPEAPIGSAALQLTDETHVSCTDITIAEEEPFQINAGLNDAWYLPETAGQGFSIVVYPDLSTFFLAWFTFEVQRPAENAAAVLGEPGHRWITAQGPYEGDTALLDIVVTKGGIFDAAEPISENSAPGSVGSIQVVFENCANGVVKYNLPGHGLAGEVPIQRISDDNVALCEALNAPSELQ